MDYNVYSVTLSSLSVYSNTDRHDISNVDFTEMWTVWNLKYMNMHTNKFNPVLLSGNTRPMAQRKHTLHNVKIHIMSFAKTVSIDTY